MVGSGDSPGLVGGQEGPSSSDRLTDGEHVRQLVALSRVFCLLAYLGRAARQEETAERTSSESP